MDGAARRATAERVCFAAQSRTVRFGLRPLRVLPVVATRGAGGAPKKPGRKGERGEPDKLDEERKSKTNKVTETKRIYSDKQKTAEY